MGFLDDLLYGIAEPLGKGLERGVQGEIDLQQQARGFRRLTPLMMERKRAEAELGQEFDIAKEGRAAEALAGEETALADLGRSLGFPLETTTMPSPERAEAELPVTTPMARLPKAGIPLLSAAARAEGKEPRAPTMTQIRQWAVTPGHPEQVRSQNLLEDYKKQQVDIFGGKLDVTGARPPDISATERGQVATARNIRELAGKIGTQFEAGGSAFVSPYTGAEWMTNLRRLTPPGTLRPSGAEETMRQDVQRLMNTIIRLEAGLTQSQKEELRQYRVLPTMSDTPERFQATLQGSVDYAQRIEDTLSGVLMESRRRQPERVRPVPRADWDLVEE